MYCKIVYSSLLINPMSAILYCVKYVQYSIMREPNLILCWGHCSQFCCLHFLYINGRKCTNYLHGT